ncbi:MAG TPA: galactokinase [Verrucomicrobiae bacterium]|nr:galactokinase [Verrucomicrobiae bacterium]
MVEAFAPGRVELLGNHTDYNGGLVLAFAVERGVTIRGTARGDRRVILRSEAFPGIHEATLDALEPSGERPWANYLIGVVAQFRARGFDGPGFEATDSSDLPSGAGLSSSAALECAMARFIQRLWGTNLPDIELARIGQAAEHEFAGVRCGLLDQITSLFGRRGKIVAIDCRSLKVDLQSAPEGCVFVVADSGVKHALVAGEYNERRASCEAAARGLGVALLRDATMAQLEAADGRLGTKPLMRARHVVGENARVVEARAALERGDVGGLGRLMFESHESSRANFENSCEELDFLVGAARATGLCRGARLSGGGFGGATVNLVREADAAEFCDALVAAYRGRYGREPALLVTHAGGAEG